MKYSILGFNQEIVCAIKKDVQTDNGNIKHLCLDVIDLLILKDFSDFMNRSKIIKLTIDDKIYFSITHKCILEDLPILGIKKQALKDRIDKMVQLGILDKKVVRDNGGTWVGYRTTKVYEDLIYSNNNQDGVYLTTRGGCSELHGGGVVNYNPNNTITINNSTINNKEEIKEENIKRNRNEYSEDFEKAWELAQRKGSKTEAYKYWKRLKEEDKKKVLAHLPFYYKSNERRYLKDFSGYLNRCYYSSVVYDKQGHVLYDPEREQSNEYRPNCDGSLVWNEFWHCYMYVGFWDGKHIPDGYSDDNRPDGASVTLNNGRGVLTWDKETKQWRNKV